jgi:hypothetical protein
MECGMISRVNRRSVILDMLALGCSCFLLTGIANAQPQQRSPDQDDIILFFYKDPRPERLIGFLASLQKSGLPWSSYPPIVGLFSAVFRKHPEWVEKLTPPDPDAKTASTLIAALRLSGNLQKAATLQTRFGAQGVDPQLTQQFADIPTIDELRIATPTHLDVLWGVSFATGDRRYPKKVIAFFADIANQSDAIAIDIAKVTASMAGGSGNILPTLKGKYGETVARQIIYGGVALWAVRANAVQHVFVRSAVDDQIEANPGMPATKVLTAIMSNAKRP